MEKTFEKNNAIKPDVSIILSSQYYKFIVIEFI